MIGFGLASSIYEDDIISFLFQLLMEVQLALSMREMGKNMPIQKKICFWTLVVFVLWTIAKIIMMISLEPNLNSDYDSIQEGMHSFGFEFITTDSGDWKFNWLESIMFELMALVINSLLFYYYIIMTPKNP